MAEVQQAGIQMAGHSRLEQIRSEMNSGSAPKAIDAGDATGAPVDDAVQQRMRELRGEA